MSTTRLPGGRKTQIASHRQFEQIIAQEPRRKEQYLKILNGTGVRIEAGYHIFSDLL